MEILTEVNISQRNVSIGQFFQECQQRLIFRGYILTEVNFFLINVKKNSYKNINRGPKTWLNL